jgi:hypothetical protein
MKTQIMSAIFAATLNLVDQRLQITDAFVITEAEAKEALPEQEIATSVMK